MIKCDEKSHDIQTCSNSKHKHSNHEFDWNFNFDKKIFQNKKFEAAREMIK